MSVNATTLLYNWIARYAETFPALNFYVKFTKVTPVVWSQVQTYGSYIPGNTLYALLSNPTAPMSPPWSGVLDYACDWAKRDTTATTATTDLTKNFYYSSTYRPDHHWYTDSSTTPETFHLQSFLQTVLDVDYGGSGLEGQCNDYSDFLTCSSTALGATAIQSQHSDAGFNYQNVLFAGDQLPHSLRSGYFNYHQWTTTGTATSGNIFDAAITFNGTQNPTNLPLLTYLNGLTSNSINGQQPFLPQIAN